MQSLGVISVNIWNILVSLLNLVVLYLIIKKFLFKPVNKMLSKRQAELDNKYQEAEDYKKQAEGNRLYWDEKMKTAKQTAEDMIKTAEDSAKRQGDSIVSKAQERAEGIVRQAENEAKLEMKKAEESIKREIIDVSSTIANKLLKREINPEDHRDLIDSFIEKIGDKDE